MSVDFYLQIISCALVTAFTGLVITFAIWFAMFVYYDLVEKHKWKNRK